MVFPGAYGKSPYTLRIAVKEERRLNQEGLEENRTVTSGWTIHSFVWNGLFENGEVENIDDIHGIGREMEGRGDFFFFDPDNLHSCIQRGQHRTACIGAAKGQVGRRRFIARLVRSAAARLRLAPAEKRHRKRRYRRRHQRRDQKPGCYKSGLHLPAIYVTRGNFCYRILRNSCTW